MMMKKLLSGLMACLMLTAVSAQAEKKPEFVHEDLEGVEHRLSDYRGKWVVVNYWATWCPPCVEEIPELDTFHVTHKDKNAVVLGVNAEDIPLEQLRAWTDDMLISYPILRSTPSPYTTFGMVTAYPTTIIVSPEGKPVARQEGPLTARHLERYIEKKTRQRQARNEAE